MNTKHYLVISGIVGGVMGSLLTALLVSPVTAQRDRFDKFGHIECTSLSVVDVEGKSRVFLAITEHGGSVSVGGKDGIPMAVLTVREHGAGLSLPMAKMENQWRCSVSMNMAGLLTRGINTEGEETLTNLKTVIID